MQITSQIRNKANELGLSWDKCLELGLFINDLMEKNDELSNDNSKFFTANEDEKQPRGHK